MSVFLAASGNHELNSLNEPSISLASFLKPHLILETTRLGIFSFDDTDSRNCPGNSRLVDGKFRQPRNMNNLNGGCSQVGPSHRRHEDFISSAIDLNICVATRTRIINVPSFDLSWNHPDLRPGLAIRYLLARPSACATKMQASTGRPTTSREGPRSLAIMLFTFSSISYVPSFDVTALGCALDH